MLPPATLANRRQNCNHTSLDTQCGKFPRRHLLGRRYAYPILSGMPFRALTVGLISEQYPRTRLSSPHPHPRPTSHDKQNLGVRYPSACLLHSRGSTLKEQMSPAHEALVDVGANCQGCRRLDAEILTSISVKAREKRGVHHA